MLAFNFIERLSSTVDATLILIIFIASVAVVSSVIVYNVLRGVRVTREAICTYFIVILGLAALTGLVGFLLSRFLL